MWSTMWRRTSTPGIVTTSNSQALDVKCIRWWTRPATCHSYSGWKSGSPTWLGQTSTWVMGWSTERSSHCYVGDAEENIKRLWLSFKDPRIGRLIRTKCNAHVRSNPELKHWWVPIDMPSAHIQLKNKVIRCKRTQFPLVAACDNHPQVAEGSTTHLYTSTIRATTSSWCTSRCREPLLLQTEIRIIDSVTPEVR